MPRNPSRLGESVKDLIGREAGDRTPRRGEIQGLLIRPSPETVLDAAAGLIAPGHVVVHYATMHDRPPDFPPEAFDKQDAGDDAAFYAPPRLVHHIDDGAMTALTAFYRSLLPPGSVVLDLMSSWVSHLPAEVAFAAVIGHGMNAEELRANPRLTERFVRDLNREPSLPLAAASCDGALCCVGVQYLQQPVAVFAEVARVLRPGSPFVVSFSNRCFPTKAVAIWRALDGIGHAQLVALYLKRSGFASVQTHVVADGSASDPLTAVVGYR